MTDVEITPEPSPSEREAILKAVRAILEDEASLARPSVWKVASWSQRRAGVLDFGGHFDDHRRWALSARLERGGRDPNSLVGRGDSK